MRSRHADAFNHDPWAAGYDAQVLDESNPIRAGYAQLLAWSVEQACVGVDSVVLDLGSGTGNTTALLPPVRTVICVDVSREMTARARDKLGHRPGVETRVADLLEVFDTPLPVFDAIVSTYAVHHLTVEERAELFRRVAGGLAPGGRAVFGDLMFEDAAAHDEIVRRWSDTERAQVLRSVDEEFPWRLDLDLPALAAAGLRVEAVERFSDLSWGIAARRPGRAEAGGTG